MAFCEAVGAGGNHLVAATAGGRTLGGDAMLRLRARELAPVLDEYRRLPEGERRVSLEDPSAAAPPRRPVPLPPEGGLVLRGFCAYLDRDAHGNLRKATRHYYEQNPDRWPAETQSDMLWWTREEVLSLLPPGTPSDGEVVPVGEAMRNRLFSTIGVDYMEGSVNALPVRESRMDLIIVRVDGGGIVLRIEGEAELGIPQGGHDPKAERSRGCSLRIAGEAVLDRNAGRFTRFELAGVGTAWGNKMEYTRREIAIDDYPWLYGIACELVTGTAPIDRLPPYNMLHYGLGQPYFGGGGG